MRVPLLQRGRWFTITERISMDNNSERLLRSCLAIIIVMGIFLGVVFIIGMVVFGTHLAGL